MNTLQFLYRLITVTLIALPLSAYGHKSSDSYLTLRMADNILTQSTGRWDIALRDLESAIGLDKNGDSTITWGELKHKHSSVNQYALSRLTIFQGGVRCTSTVTNNLVTQHSDGAYAALHFAILCPVQQGDIKIKYTLFSDLDSRHRGLLKVLRGAQTQLATLTATHQEVIISARTAAIPAFIMDFIQQGILHIFQGFDHLLFLVCLLLPVVLLRETSKCSTQVTFSGAVIEMLKIVTAFTVAHAVTLCLAVFDVVQLPSRVIESLIAVSVLMAATNMVFPFIRKARWQIGFAFGLVHGFGFANVLHGLDLSTTLTAAALLSFNLGVELAQLIIAGILLPLAYYIRTYRFYQQYIVPIGALAVMMISFVWLIERSLDVKLGV